MAIIIVAAAVRPRTTSFWTTSVIFKAYASTSAERSAREERLLDRTIRKAGSSATAVSSSNRCRSVNRLQRRLWGWACWSIDASRSALDRSTIELVVFLDHNTEHMNVPSEDELYCQVRSIARCLCGWVGRPSRLLGRMRAAAA